MDLSPNKLNSFEQLKEVFPKEPLKTEEPKPIGHEQLRDALFYMQDIIERCQMPFIVLGTVGRQIDELSDPTLIASELELGILKAHYTESGKSILWSLLDQYHLNAKDEGDEIALEYKGVPVFIKIIKGKYRFFEYPNTKFFFVENLSLPNPFSEYWSKRKEIE